MDTTTAIETLAMEKLGVSQALLRSAKTFEEAGIDSLGAIDLVFAIESHFGVLLDTKELDTVGSVQDLITVVERLLAGGERSHVA